MVDIRKNFNDSFNVLLHHKKIIVPVFFSILVPMLLIILFLNLSGFSVLMKEYLSVQQEFNQQKLDYLMDTDNMKDGEYKKELVGYLAKGSQDSEYAEELAVYAEDSGFDWVKLKQLLNKENAILFVVLLLIGIISSFYLSSMSYAIIALVIKKQEITAENVLKVTNAFFLRFIALRFLLSFLIISPIIIFLAVCGLLFYINKILLVLAVILFIILFIIYVIILTLRLFFSLPSMFLDYPGPIKAIQNSWNLSKGRFKQVFIIYGVVIGLTFFFNTFIGQPMQSSFVEFVFGLSIIKVIVGFVLLVLFLILESFVFTFEHLFIFLSYIDFKGLDSIVKK